MMKRSEESVKAPAATAPLASVSALVDGDIDPAGLREAMAQLALAEGKQAWDLYHQIGDAIRNAEPGPEISAGFGARFAERLAAEPVLLPPRPGLLARLGTWPATIAAVAAAGVGFFVAPALMRDPAPYPRHVDTAASTAAQRLTAGSDAASVRPTAQAAVDTDGTLDYIALHHVAHASLYGAAPASRPAVLDTASNR